MNDQSLFKNIKRRIASTFTITDLRQIYIYTCQYSGCICIQESFLKEHAKLPDNPIFLFLYLEETNEIIMTHDSLTYRVLVDKMRYNIYYFDTHQHENNNSIWIYEDTDNITESAFFAFKCDTLKMYQTFKSFDHVIPVLTDHTCFHCRSDNVNTINETVKNSAIWKSFLQSKNMTGVAASTLDTMAFRAMLNHFINMANLFTNEEIMVAEISKSRLFQQELLIDEFYAEHFDFINRMFRLTFITSTYFNVLKTDVNLIKEDVDFILNMSRNMCDYRKMVDSIAIILFSLSRSHPVGTQVLYPFIKMQSSLCKLFLYLLTRSNILGTQVPYSSLLLSMNGVDFQNHVLCAKDVSGIKVRKQNTFDSHTIQIIKSSYYCGIEKSNLCKKCDLMDVIVVVDTTDPRLDKKIYEIIYKSITKFNIYMHFGKAYIHPKLFLDLIYPQIIEIGINKTSVALAERMASVKKEMYRDKKIRKNCSMDGFDTSDDPFLYIRNAVDCFDWASKNIYQANETYNTKCAIDHPMWSPEYGLWDRQQKIWARVVKRLGGSTATLGADIKIPSNISFSTKDVSEFIKKYVFKRSIVPLCIRLLLRKLYKTGTLKYDDRQILFGFFIETKIVDKQFFCELLRAFLQNQPTKPKYVENIIYGFSNWWDKTQTQTHSMKGKDNGTHVMKFCSSIDICPFKGENIHLYPQTKADLQIQQTIDIEELDRYFVNNQKGGIKKRANSCYACCTGDTVYLKGDTNLQLRNTKPSTIFAAALQYTNPVS